MRQKLDDVTGQPIPALSAHQREEQRAQMVFQINATTREVDRLILRDREREAEMRQLRDDLNALATRHETLVTMHHHAQRSLYRRLREMFGR